MQFLGHSLVQGDLLPFGTVRLSPQPPFEALELVGTNENTVVLGEKNHVGPAPLGQVHDGYFAGQPDDIAVVSSSKNKSVISFPVDTPKIEKLHITSIKPYRKIA